ncbi:type II toxin-antitoxin system Phd/YefM family antitoxin [Synergistaceae bacterium OttesenSCG-928-I11]|nr:type II toxin-antitoxin system Phd/YefM family antitoxin [Synergistaceae bacterium OttesenSCG-928-I11]
METIAAREAKISFGDTIRRAQKAPVQITNHGNPVAVVMSMEDYRITEEFRMQYLREKLERGRADIEAGRVFDVDKVFDEVLAGNYD